MSAKTKKDITSYEKFIFRDIVRSEAHDLYEQYERAVLEDTGLTAEAYREYYDMLSRKQVPVRKIYENVIDPRPLGAYNVRFSDEFDNRY
jgi:hypothetical protein